MDNNRWRLDGAFALVTGGTRGIGRAIVEDLSDFGAEVFVAARDAERLRTRLDDWQRAGRSVDGIAADVSTADGRQQIIDACALRRTSLNILVNNAGTNIRRGTLEYDDATTRSLLELNLIAPFELARLAHPLLKAAGNASIVNIVSVAGMTALGTGAPYAMSKAGVIQLSRNLAAEWAADGIRVNAVAPWFITTDLTTAVLQKEAFMKEVLHRTPAGRVGSPEEVSGIVAFLTLPAASTSPASALQWTEDSPSTAFHHRALEDDHESILGRRRAVGRPLSAQLGANVDTIRAGRFDFGKMWTFENAPTRYFSDTYGFAANAAWFDRARGAALRIPGCSAAFVSPHGLVVTNHHCIRGAVAQLSRPGENLLDNGFYASSLQDERKIPNFFADQLIAVEDVSAEILAAMDRAPDEAARAPARVAAINAARQRLAQARNNDPNYVVQVVGLYNNARFSAYTFRRYTDVRLVAAAELQMGFFGGDPDNFTYPRYALDFGFLRVYGPDGKPLENQQYFGWSERGVQENDVVFVIGNPGTTSRLNTVAQMEYLRDVPLPAQERVFDSRIRALWEFYREDRKAGDSLDVRNLAFGLSNTWKQFLGQINAINNPFIMARKRDAERQLRDSINAKPALKEYSGIFDRIAALQPRYRELAPYFNAFTLWNSGAYESGTMRRAILAQQIESAAERNIPADTVAAMRQRLSQIKDFPRGLERRLLIARLRDFATLPANDPIRVAALGNDTPEAAADKLLAPGGAELALRIAAAANPRFVQYISQLQQLGAEQAALAVQLGRARFEVYGTTVPPDGSGSPRITDGVVKPYEYNGTEAPVYTTFFGLYDRYFAFGADSDWNLPKRWVPVPKGLDLNTPLNFISTADTYGGNSGSPAVTKDLALVGLNFDRNIEGMSRNFIYLPERGRNIMVDVRAIREALDDVYDADRIVLEVLTHKLYATEREADAAPRPPRN